MKKDNSGYLLIEIILAVAISAMVIGLGGWMLVDIMKEWSVGESHLEVSYNSREAFEILSKEIIESYGVEILDASDNGWIKVYKSYDKSEFITFRMKNNKLYIGLNNTLNSNAEFALGVKKFKTEYLPSGAEFQDSTGAKVMLEVGDDKKTATLETSLAFRCKP